MPEPKQDKTLPVNIADGRLRLGFDENFLSLWDKDYQADFLLELTEEQKEQVRIHFKIHRKKNR